MRWILGIIVVLNSHSSNAIDVVHYIPFWQNEAELIVEGNTSDDIRKVTITKIYKRPNDFKRTEEILVSDLENQDLTLWQGLKRPINPPRIKATGVVLFLAFDPANRRWLSQRTIWFDAKQCYWFQKDIDIGPLHLYPNSNIEAVRKKLLSSIAASGEWDSILFITDLNSKAERISRYLIARTSPDKSGAYRFPAREEMVKLGEAAIEPILAQLKDSRSEDCLDELVLTIEQLGPRANKAVPFLCRMLKSPGKSSLVNVIRAIRTNGSIDVLDDVRPLLFNKSVDIQTEVMITLAMFRDVRSKETIARIISESITNDNKYQIRDMINALWHLDPDFAEPLIRKIEANPSFADIKDQFRRWDQKLPVKPLEEEF